MCYTLWLNIHSFSIYLCHHTQDEQIQVYIYNPTNTFVSYRKVRGDYYTQEIDINVLFSFGISHIEDGTTEDEFMSMVKIK